jgi:hypothetical protein
MEDLFTTQLQVNGSKVQFRVVFDHEQYIFLPEMNEAGKFSVRREHDEWQVENQIPQELRSQAVEALERYLLKQH